MPYELNLCSSEGVSSRGGSRARRRVTTGVSSSTSLFWTIFVAGADNPHTVDLSFTSYISASQVTHLPPGASFMIRSISSFGIFLWHDAWRQRQQARRSRSPNRLLQNNPSREVQKRMMMTMTQMSRPALRICPRQLQPRYPPQIWASNRG